LLLHVQKPENCPDIAVGELIALIVEPGADWKSVEVPATATAAPPPPTPAPAADTDTSVPATPVS